MERDKQHLGIVRRLDEKKEFRDSCKEFQDKYPLFEKLLRGIKIDLQDYAHLEKNCHSGIYWKETAEVYGLPSFVICYSFDEKTVVVYSIELNHDD